jgi:uncharacterized membrane protein YeaQ/YmgE (transglycosylase-associated protein family)
MATVKYVYRVGTDCQFVNTKKCPPDATRQMRLANRKRGKLQLTFQNYRYVEIICSSLGLEIELIAPFSGRSFR